MRWDFSGREKLEGQFVGFASGDTQAQCYARVPRLKMLPEMEGVQFGHDFLPAFGVAKIADEKKIALKPSSVKPAEQRREHSGLKIEAFPQRPLFKFGGAALPAFAES